ncbi:MAG: hypothetical protein IBJ15_23060 [Alphaproteobacteria bacterium]|nr:hypothetical protein [Alphaproteobacteria bacterium]
MSKNTEASAADLAADIAALREDVAKLATTLGKAAKARASDAGETAADAGSAITEKLADTAAGARKQLRVAGAKLEAGIEQHPMAAMLIAFGVGLSLAMATRARG